MLVGVEVMVMVGVLVEVEVEVEVAMIVGVGVAGQGPYWNLCTSVVPVELPGSRPPTTYMALPATSPSVFPRAKIMFGRLLQLFVAGL